MKKAVGPCSSKSPEQQASTFHDWILGAKSNYKGRPLVRLGAKSLDFESFCTQVRHYLAFLSSARIERNGLVAVIADPSPWTLALQCAISASGNAFCCLDTTLPPGQMKRTLDWLEPCSLIVSRDYKESTPTNGFRSATIEPDGAITGQTAPIPGSKSNTTQLPANTAYVICTSGTTGTPKGIIMTHDAVSNFFLGMSSSVPCSSRSLLTVAPLCFDFSILDIGLALSKGATLVQLPRKLLLHAESLIDYLVVHQVDHVNAVPSFWKLLIRDAESSLSRLNVESILYAGEPFTLAEVRKIQRLIDGVRIFNCFGQSESIASCFYEIPNPSPELAKGIPIGRPHLGAAVELIDEEGSPLQGEVTSGEMVLRSTALFSGYYKDPSLSSARISGSGKNRAFRTGDMLSRDQNGLLYFDGRRDNQLKLHGKRIELEEIENTIREIPGASDACVIALSQDGRPTKLCALVETSERSGKEIRTSLSEHLPPHKIPGDIACIRLLPRLSNGKPSRIDTYNFFSTQTNK